MLNRIKEFWYKNRTEIIESVTNAKQGKKKQEDTEEKIKREQWTVRILLIIGIIYVVVGAILLRNLKDNLFVTEFQNVVIAVELIILGIYSLLYAFILCCEKRRWKGRRLVKIIKEIFIFLMLPYYLCINMIKVFIKDKRQEHVMHFFPYYLISLLIVMGTFYFGVYNNFSLGISEAYNELVGFIIVFCLILEFFGCGKIFAYFLTKSVIKSVQKAEVKKLSKINWRNIFNDASHKSERREKFKKEWEIVKKELEYTEIYFYIILTVLVLWIPKAEGSLTELLVNQFLGITTIAALARETKAKKAEED